jgi:hypothetical protein
MLGPNGIPWAGNLFKISAYLRQEGLRGPIRCMSTQIFDPQNGNLSMSETSTAGPLQNFDREVPLMMAWLQRSEDLLNRRARIVASIVAVCGLLWRLYYASDFYLNPDEAMHFTIAATDWHGWVGFYRNASRSYHPPLFFPVLRGMLLLGHSEWLLRLVPTVAGALFPWFIMLWVQRFAGNAAALCAQLLLTFSPALINLSTEVRGYTLAFLFFSICLVLLEDALDHGSKRYMIWFHVFLYLAILTEYCVALFVVAVGVYALLRLWRRPASSVIRATWILGQVGALSLYLFLYFTHLSGFSHTAVEDMYNTWLRGGFPRSHDHLWAFALRGTYQQFSYLFQIRLLAWLGAIAFALGLSKLWRGKSPLCALLLVLPFCVACLGAIFHLFPYGDSRHTAILGIVIAAGLGAAVSSVTRNRILPILMIALPMIFLWNLLAAGSSLTIPRSRRHLSAMHEAIEYLGTSVPPGSMVVTDVGTDLILGYYLGCPDYEFDGSNEPYRMRQCPGLRFVVAPTFQFSGPGELRDALSRVQSKYHLQQTVWVAAGGFDIHVANPVSESRPFGTTMAIFKDSDLSFPSPGNSKP